MNKQYYLEVPQIRAGFKMNLETFDNAMEILEVSDRRTKGPRFDDYRDSKRMSKEFNGVTSFDEARELLNFGYQAAVSQLSDGIGAGLAGEIEKRFAQTQSVVGFAPIVPLAIMGVPNCMILNTSKPVKQKVLTICYDVGANQAVRADALFKAGSKLIGAITELELKGYRINLYAIKSQTQHDNSCDALCVKIKNSDAPMDIKRMSFPIAHPGFFRTIAWDWYSRNPNSKFRFGLGHSLSYEYDDNVLSVAFSEILKTKCIFVSAKGILNQGENYLKGVFTGNDL